MTIDDIRGQICGLWVDEGGIVHVCARTSDGGRVAHTLPAFRPFAWTRADATPPVIEGATSEPLAGDGPFSRLIHVTHPDLLDAVEGAVGKGAYDAVNQLESQFLMQHRARLFADVAFGQLRRCQLDIETASEDGSFSDAKRPEDRVLAIGLRTGGRNRLLVLEDLNDAA
ncbi:MAG TPA: DNA polymerase, partial [Opitutaceae bacterium]|nr:DNA polymerase [Opitutaceae bacterium]